MYRLFLPVLDVGFVTAGRVRSVVAQIESLAQFDMEWVLRKGKLNVMSGGFVCLVKHRSWGVLKRALGRDQFAWADKLTKVSICRTCLE